MKNRLFTLPIAAIITLFISLHGCDSKKTVGPSSDETADLKVIVKDEYGRPVVDGKLTTNPFSGEVVTDSEGRAVLPELPIMEYTLYLRRPNFPVYSMIVAPSAENSQEVLFVIPTEPPTASITFPSNSDFVSIQDIKFSGEGIDPENGALPDSLLIWTSSVDGELGFGRDLTIESMSLGSHKISLLATDLDGKSNEVSIDVVLVDYNPNTFFPILPGAEWTYTHLTPKFSLVNTSGNIENWMLNNISVSSDKNNIRTTTMSYQMQSLSSVREYRYVITDYLDIQGDRVIVTKTKENIKIWRGNPYGSPTDELTIETLYSPEYVLIENSLNPAETGSYTNNNQLAVKWSYNDPFYGLREFTESFHIETTIDVGPAETIDISNQAVTAFPITITQANSLKKWWLAQGIGMVRLSYNSFEMSPLGTFPIADLISTNLAGLAGKRLQMSKPAFAYDSFSGTALNDVPVPADDGIERLRALRTLFSYIAP